LTRLGWLFHSFTQSPITTSVEMIQHHHITSSIEIISNSIQIQSNGDGGAATSEEHQTSNLLTT